MDFMMKLSTLFKTKNAANKQVSTMFLFSSLAVIFSTSSAFAATTKDSLRAELENVVAIQLDSESIRLLNKSQSLKSYNLGIDITSEENDREEEFHTQDYEFEESKVETEFEEGEDAFFGDWDIFGSAYDNEAETQQNEILDGDYDQKASNDPASANLEIKTEDSNQELNFEESTSLMILKDKVANEKQSHFILYNSLDLVSSAYARFNEKDLENNFSFYQDEVFDGQTINEKEMLWLERQEHLLSLTGQKSFFKANLEDILSDEEMNSVKSDKNELNILKKHNQFYTLTNNSTTKNDQLFHFRFEISNPMLFSVRDGNGKVIVETTLKDQEQGIFSLQFPSNKNIKPMMIQHSTLKDSKFVMAIIAAKNLDEKLTQDGLSTLGLEHLTPTEWHAFLNSIDTVKSKFLYPAFTRAKFIRKTKIVSTLLAGAATIASTVYLYINEYRPTKNLLDQYNLPLSDFFRVKEFQQLETPQKRREFAKEILQSEEDQLFNFVQHDPFWKFLSQHLPNEFHFDFPRNIGESDFNQYRTHFWDFYNNNDLEVNPLELFIKKLYNLEKNNNFLSYGDKLDQSLIPHFDGDPNYKVVPHQHEKNKLCEYKGCFYKAGKGLFNAFFLARPDSRDSLKSLITKVEESPTLQSDEIYFPENPLIGKEVIVELISFHIKNTILLMNDQETLASYLNDYFYKDSGIYGEMRNDDIIIINVVNYLIKNDFIDPQSEIIKYKDLLTMRRNAVHREREENPNNNDEHLYVNGDPSISRTLIEKEYDDLAKRAVGLDIPEKYNLSLIRKNVEQGEERVDKGKDCEVCFGPVGIDKNYACCGEHATMCSECGALDLIAGNQEIPSCQYRIDDKPCGKELQFNSVMLNHLVDLEDEEGEKIVLPGRRSKSGNENEDRNTIYNFLRKKALLKYQGVIEDAEKAANVIPKNVEESEENTCALPECDGYMVKAESGFDICSDCLVNTSPVNEDLYQNLANNHYMSNVHPCPYCHNPVHKFNACNTVDCICGKTFHYRLGKTDEFGSEITGVPGKFYMHDYPKGGNDQESKRQALELLRKEGLHEEANLLEARPDTTDFYTWRWYRVPGDPDYDANDSERRENLSFNLWNTYYTAYNYNENRFKSQATPGKNRFPHPEVDPRIDKEDPLVKEVKKKNNSR